MTNLKEVEDFWSMVLSDNYTPETESIKNVEITPIKNIEKSAECFNKKQMEREDFTGFKSPIFKLKNSKGYAKFGN